MQWEEEREDLWDLDNDKDFLDKEEEQLYVTISIILDISWEIFLTLSWTLHIVEL